MKNKSIIFTKRPKDFPTNENFSVQDNIVPVLNDNQILLKTVYVSVDPYLRGRMNNVKSYIPPFEVGEPMKSAIVAEVIESKNKNYSVGSHLYGMLDWKTFQVSDGTGLFPIPKDLAPLSSYLGVIGSVVAFMLIGYFGMWKDCMATVAIITVCTIMCIAVGIPIGVLMARSDRVERAMLPVLDMMQTIPSFVYLIPILMLLGIGKIPGLIAVCIYAIPPVIRLTNLGIREVDKETIEASEAFGATKLQKLRTVQIPLALPTVFAGVNQTIMMALAMVVIASMIGVKGLGVPILRAISNQYLALGLFNGLAIVALAIIFDRITQEYGRRIQKHRGTKR